jgi:NCS2 family nucleobase:cation symporter-2/xanthine permease XanP
MFTAAFSIPFCITAVIDGGPATLTTLVIVTAVVQLFISKWLFILRRIVTPTVGGTVMMILSITLASVVFGLLDQASEAEPVAAPLTALATLVVVAALTLRGRRFCACGVRLLA